MVSVKIVLNVYNSHNSQLGVGLDVILNVDVCLHIMQHRALITAITAVQDLVTLPLHGNTLLLVCTKELKFFGTFTELKIFFALKFNIVKNFLWVFNFGQVGGPDANIPNHVLGYTFYRTKNRH